MNMYSEDESYCPNEVEPIFNINVDVNALCKKLKLSLVLIDKQDELALEFLKTVSPILEKIPIHFSDIFESHFLTHAEKYNRVPLQLMFERNHISNVYELLSLDPNEIRIFIRKKSKWFKNLQACLASYGLKYKY